MNISTMISEDVGTPELRNPLASAMKKESWLRRLLKRKKFQAVDFALLHMIESLPRATAKTARACV